MLSQFVITAAALAAFASPALAANMKVPEPRAPQASWTILKNASDQVCHGADRKDRPVE